MKAYPTMVIELTLSLKQGVKKPPHGICSDMLKSLNTHLWHFASLKLTNKRMISIDFFCKILADASTTYLFQFRRQIVLCTSVSCSIVKDVF